MITSRRSYNMSRIRGKDTKPEMIIPKYLRAHGFRYRLNHRLPGKSDVVLRKYRTCIFVNGCFWHGHNLDDEIIYKKMSMTNDIQSSGCCKIPHANREFWVNKIVRNKHRDVDVQHQLADMGWLA